MKESVLKPLETFRGDLQWIHDREGHDGGVYWPGGQSGPTLDPGVDIGYFDRSLFKRLYSGILSREQIRALDPLWGLKGQAAKQAVDNASDTVKSIRISRSEASDIKPYVFADYWRNTCRRWPQIEDRRVPGVVHTAVGSIAYNRGEFNRHTAPIGDFITDGIETWNWRPLANFIAGMQQGHSLSGIRKRRRKEARLISDWISEKRDRLRQELQNRQNFFRKYMATVQFAPPLRPEFDLEKKTRKHEVS